MSEEEKKAQIKYIISLLDRLGLVLKEEAPHNPEAFDGCHQTYCSIFSPNQI